LLPPSLSLAFEISASNLWLWFAFGLCCSVAGQIRIYVNSMVVGSFLNRRRWCWGWFQELCLCLTGGLGFWSFVFIIPLPLIGLFYCCGFFPIF
jgi:hypothetical protein